MVYWIYEKVNFNQCKFILDEKDYVHTPDLKLFFLINML